MPSEYSGADVSKQKKKPVKKAVALQYQPSRDAAPVVTAKGQGLVAEKIIALAKKERKSGAIVYRQTMRLLKIWQANRKNTLRKSIAVKLASHTHTSAKRAYNDVIFIKATKNKDYIINVSEQIEL